MVLLGRVARSHFPRCFAYPPWFSIFRSEEGHLVVDGSVATARIDTKWVEPFPLAFHVLFVNNTLNVLGVNRLVGCIFIPLER
jgi:hypothetical protein